MSKLSQFAKIACFTVGLICPNVSLCAKDAVYAENSRQADLRKKAGQSQRPADEKAPEYIIATLIGDDLHIGLEEQAGQSNVTVTNSITGSSFQTTVSSANPVVYNIGGFDVPLIINVETSDNVSYEGVMMPE